MATLHRDYNLYDLLGLTPAASREQIIRAYRKLAKHFHPDLNMGDRKKAVIFRMIHQAYKILSHPVKREAYDKMIAPGLFGKALVWIRRPLSEVPIRKTA